MNIIVRFLLGIFIITSSFSCLADNLRNYDADYYANEGSLLFKFRPFYSSLDGDMSNLPTPKNGSGKPKALVERGYGFDSATTYFLGENVATELSLGVGYHKVKKSSINKVQELYGTGASTGKKSNDIWMFPLAGTLQYHIAPYGAIRPYLGAGGHATYAYTKSKGFKINNGYGAVFQAGVDIVAKDDTFVTLDIRHFTMKSKIRFNKEFLGTREDLSSKVKWNPTIISLGFGFIF